MFVGENERERERQRGGEMIGAKRMESIAFSLENTLIFEYLDQNINTYYFGIDLTRVHSGQYEILKQV